jgi:hypothetical protein
MEMKHQAVKVLALDLCQVSKLPNNADIELLQLYTNEL